MRHYDIEINGRIRHLVVDGAAGAFTVEVDGRRFLVSAARVDPQTLSLLVRPESDGETGEDRPPREMPPPREARPAREAPERAPSTVVEAAVVPDSSSGMLDVRIGPVSIAAALAAARGWPPGARGPRSTQHGGETAPRSAGSRSAAPSSAGPQRIVAPMPGKIVRVLVSEGDAVTVRQPLVVVEAMKMENELRASRSGTVVEVQAHEGRSVEAGATLIVIQ